MNEAGFRAAVIAHFHAQHDKSGKHDLIGAFARFAEGQGEPNDIGEIFSSLPKHVIPIQISEHLKKLPDALRADYAANKQAIDRLNNELNEGEANEIQNPEQLFPEYLAWLSELDSMVCNLFFEPDFTPKPWLEVFIGKENYKAAVVQHGKQAIAHMLMSAFMLVPDTTSKLAELEQELPNMIWIKLPNFPSRRTPEQLNESISEGRIKIQAGAIVDLHSSDPDIVLTAYLRFGTKPGEHPNGDYFGSEVLSGPLPPIKTNATRVMNTGLKAKLKILPKAILDHLKKAIDALEKDLQKNGVDPDPGTWGDNPPKANIDQFPNYCEWRSQLAKLMINQWLDSDLNLKPQIIDAIGETIYDECGKSDKDGSIELYLLRAIELFIPTELAEQYRDSPEVKLNPELGNFISGQLWGGTIHPTLTDFRKYLLLARLEKDIKILKRQLQYKPDNTKGHELTKAALTQLEDMQARVKNILTERDLMLNPQEGKKPTEHAEKELKSMIAEHKQIQRLYEAKRKLVTVHDALIEMETQLDKKIKEIDEKMKHLTQKGTIRANAPLKALSEQRDALHAIQHKIEPILKKIDTALKDATVDNLEATKRAADRVIADAKGLEADVKGQAAEHRGIFTTLADMFKQLWAALKGERPGSLSTLGMVKSVAKGMTQLAKRSGFWSPAEATKAGDSVQMQEEQDGTDAEKNAP